VSGEIEKLVKLQELFLFRQQKTRERENLPPEFADADREYREKLATIQTLRNTVEEAEKARRVSEAELSDLTEKQKKYQAQLMAVKNSREYGAMLNEIDQVKKELREVEERVFALMETLETSSRELSERQDALPRETEEHEQALSGWRETQKEIDREIAEANQRIQDLEKTFPPKTLSEFRRLFERKGGQAVVRAVAGSCSACHVRLRPALYQALRISTEVVTCDSCKRILYYLEDEAAGS
jgi:predicted  nucleic acid-binding Zn-ribbon protein